MSRKRAFVVNGRKNVRHRVFLIRGGYIVREWHTDVYLALSKKEIDAGMSGKHLTALGYWDGEFHFK